MDISYVKITFIIIGGLRYFFSLLLRFDNKEFKFRNIPSEITSLNHRDIENIRLIIAKNNILIPFTKPWKDKMALKVVANKQKLVFKGQGEGDTKWKG